MTWTSAFGRACAVLLRTIVRWLALTKINPNVLTFMSKAFADMTARMAYDTSVVWAGERPPHKGRGPQSPRHRVYS